MTLTHNERLMLTCLFSIMKGQRMAMAKAGIDEPDGENDIPTEKQCSVALETLHYGYSALYEHCVFAPMRVYPEMPQKDGEFVMNVFHMYDDISRYMEENPEDDEICNHEDGKFKGFDGNNDSKCYAFARFWTEKLGFYADMVAGLDRKTPGGINRDPFNSHSGITREIYEAMLEEWQKHRYNPPMSREQILAILNASKGGQNQE